MSEKKLSLLEKRMAQFAESTTELLTDIHARNKGASKIMLKKVALKKKKRMKQSTSIPDTDKKTSG